ncbi:MAG: hypothetical protein WD064_05295, partial [Acidimicrobiia bacterium]
NVTAPVFAGVAIYATFGVFSRPKSARMEPSPAFGPVLLAALVVGGLIVDYQDFPFADPIALTLWLACAAAAVVLPGWAARTGNARGLYVMLWVVLVSSAVIGARLILAAQDGVGVSDVFAFHEAAAQALLEGENPYEAARVVNSDPNVPLGTITTGYPYPPISMAPMAASSAWFGDSRWILLASWLGMIAVLGARAIASGGAHFQSVLLLSLFPAFRVTLFVGWTELLLMGMASMLVLGTSEPGRLNVWRTAVLAALASSKQYMVFLAPLALVVRSFRIPLSLSTLGLTAATLIPYLLVDSRSVYHALYENLATIGDRPDSFSISGMLQTLGVATGGLPRLVWIAITLVFGYLIARRIRDVGDFVLGAALVLGFAFLTGVAFVNYWLLCAGLVLVGSLMKTSQGPD